MVLCKQYIVVHPIMQKKDMSDVHSTFTNGAVGLITPDLACVV
jgi:hypothetical protein